MKVNEAGTVVRMTGSCWDVTEQSQATGTPDDGSMRSMLTLTISVVRAGRIGSVPSSLLRPLSAKFLAARIVRSPSSQKLTPCCTDTKRPIVYSVFRSV